MQTRTHHVAVLAGDGIGPEVMAEALKVMDAAAKKFGFTVPRDERLVGGAAIDACGGSAQGQSAMAKLNTKVSIGMKTITDKSTRNLAEMLTQGSSMGVMDCIKSQKDYPDAAPGSKRLMQKLQDFEEDNRLKLEQYL